MITTVRFWRTRSLTEIQKRGRWCREKRREVRKARSVAQGNLEAVTRKYGQLVMSRMSRLLSGALPPPPPVLTRLVRNRALSQKLVVAPSCTVFSSKLSVKAEMVGFSCLCAVQISSSVAKLHVSLLNSPIVRNVLRGWFARGDIAAVGMTQPLALSTASCLLEKCQQANVAGFFAELNSNTSRQSFVHCANSRLVFQQECVLMAYRSGNVYAVLCQRSGTLEAGSTL